MSIKMNLFGGVVGDECCIKIDGNKDDIEAVKEFLIEKGLEYKTYDSAEAAHIDEIAYGDLENEYFQNPDLICKENEELNDFISSNITSLIKALNEQGNNAFSYKNRNETTDIVLRENGYIKTRIKKDKLIY